MKSTSLKIYNPAEIATVLYLLITGIFIVVFYNKIESAWFYLLARIIMSSVIFFFARIRLQPRPNQFSKFIFSAYPLLFLSFLYPETDALNNVFFENLDFKFVFFEYSLFGYQPSIAFYKNFPDPWIIELMSFGYFSYYLFIIGAVIWFYLLHNDDFQRVLFILCASFFLYYILFILFPVVGPQFYFSTQDRFIGEAGIFRWAMHWIEFLGERPTAAFPSSHVGICVIILILVFQRHKLFSLTLLPFSILLITSTVYMKAHYFVDVVAGLITGILFYMIFSFIYQQISYNSQANKISS